VVFVPIGYSSSAVVGRTGETWQSSDVLRRRRRGHYREAEACVWSHNNNKEGTDGVNSAAAWLDTQARLHTQANQKQDTWNVHHSYHVVQPT
jgi:hypothetical protein